MLADAGDWRLTQTCRGAPRLNGGSDAGRQLNWIDRWRAYFRRLTRMKPVLPSTFI